MLALADNALIGKDSSVAGHARARLGVARLGEVGQGNQGVVLHKTIKSLDGRLVMRPAQNHPNPAHWQALREDRIAAQGGSCGVCWRPGADLHHRHYDTWGEEKAEDVVFLCRECHEAITTVIRRRRYAAGDRTPEVTEDMTSNARSSTIEAPAFRMTGREIKVQETGAEIKPDRPRFQMASRLSMVDGG